MIVVEPDLGEQPLRSLFLSNYATCGCEDELSRVPGVGDVHDLRRQQLLDAGLAQPGEAQGPQSDDAGRVTLRSRSRTSKSPPGRSGSRPSPDTLDFQYIVTALGRLSDPSSSRTSSSRRAKTDRVTYLKDVARVELGGQNYDQYRRKGRRALGEHRPSFNFPGANALEVAEGVREAVERDGASRSPKGCWYDFPLDTTTFVEASIETVYNTIIEAGVLVLIVILVFLQDWRAVLVPATTVPVTIIGAFAAMYALGFSVNMLTLFGLVLAIGIVVDDAIVIVEAAAHHIERGMAPARGDDPRDGAGAGADHRHHAGADGRVSSDGVSGRHHRAAVPAVRADDRRDGADQRHQRRDAQAGAVRHLPAEAAGAEELVLPRLQLRLRLRRARLHRRSSAACCGSAG